LEINRIIRSAFTNVLLGIPKELIINVDNAPIRLNGVELQNQLFTKQVLANTLLLHFKNQALQEIYKVVGSADMFGNPVGFVQSLGTGVIDFFYEPAKGIAISPKEFVSGVGKGSFSLVKNTISGAFNTASKITGSIGSGMHTHFPNKEICSVTHQCDLGVASLSADNDYQIQRLEDIQQNKPKHVFEGIGRGLLSFGRGIFDGISGLVTQPIKGSQQEGAAGFFKGMGRGFAGVVVKPVVGALDLASKTTEGIKNTTDLFQPSVNRKRLPRHFKTGKLEVSSS
jgi:vacuolar protein sorting-associated protein 13A/C